MTSKTHRPAAIAAIVLLTGCPSKPAAPTAQPTCGPTLCPARRGAAQSHRRERGPVCHLGRAPRVPPPSTVCAVPLEANRKHYRLATFGSAAEAGERGYRITQPVPRRLLDAPDLAVYLERPDLTTPVRQWDESGTLRCLEALGFTHGCAQIWNFNVQTPGGVLRDTACAARFPGEVSTKPDGMLNDCLQCDEDRSGAVFKAVAGRTRRDSGIRSSIQRPDEQVSHVVHDYVP